MNDRLASALADRYRIERELGAGGMATVYLAHDLKHDRKVAIKVLRPELAAVIGAERFLKEIKTTANLQHPHILGLIDSGSADGLLWYVMPFVEGESLRDRLQREKQLPIADAVRIATEVASALDYAHRHGVIHRDIKPENILLHDGSALVADFGIALAASTAGTRMTETGMSLGTPHYMSPEQAMGEREITARSDVYALGCVTYEMLVGEPPFTGPTAQAIIARVMTEEPRSLTLQRKTIPPHVEAAVLTALEKLPADRFATAAEFAAALSDTSPATAHRMAGRTPAFPSPRPLAFAPWILHWWRLRLARGAGFVRAPPQIGRSSGITSPSATARSSRQLVRIGPPLALSPDGSRLAFIGDTLSRIWVKRRDALEPALLPGTDGASSPVFSPDGAWIAYVAERSSQEGARRRRSQHHPRRLGRHGIRPGVARRRNAGLHHGFVARDAPGEPVRRSRHRGSGRFGVQGPRADVADAAAARARHPLRCLRIGLRDDGPPRTRFQDRPRKVARQRRGDGLVSPDRPVSSMCGATAWRWRCRSTLARSQTPGAAVPVLQGVELTLAIADLAWSPSGALVYGNGVPATTSSRCSAPIGPARWRSSIRRGPGNSIRSRWRPTGGAPQSASARRAAASTSGSSSSTAVRSVASPSAVATAVPPGRPTAGRSPSCATAGAAATSTRAPSTAAAPNAGWPTS